MQQLQQTVERLAEKVSRGIDKSDLCQSLSQHIKTIDADIAAIDRKLESFHRRKSTILQSSSGHELIERGVSLIDKAPWLVSTVSEWEGTRLMDFIEAVEWLSTELPGYGDVNGYEAIAPPSSCLIAGAAARAGGIVSSITSGAVHAVSSFPHIGGFTGARSYCDRKELELSQIMLSGNAPSSKEEWSVVHSTLVRSSQHWSLYQDKISDLIDKENWPRDEIYDERRSA